MRRGDPDDPTSVDLPAPDGYFARSRRPLQILIFLSPLVVLYEVAMLSLLRTGDGMTHTNRAHMGLLWIFDAMGIQASGWYLPGIALVVVLLAWHVLSREPWRVDGRTLLGMVVESMVLAVPLIVLGQMVARLVTVDDAPVAMNNAAAAAPISTTGRVAMSFGAGLYEELVFRMLIIATLHAMLVDVIGAKAGVGTTVAIAVSAILFAVYHFVPADASIPFDWILAGFYVLAGVYFGVLFVVRGFGIVVAAHALYDVVAVLGPETGLTP